MKKKIIIIIVLVVIVISIIIGLLTNNKSNDELNGKPLIVVTNYRMKYGATFEGTAIFDDGEIYSWYYSSTKSEYYSYIGNYSINTKEGFKEFVLDKATKKDNNISNSDLSSIKRLINKLSDQDIVNNCEVDENSYTTITIFKEEILKISTSDNCNNKSDRVNELINIVNKYLKK